MRKYESGLVLGKFYPPHMGHIHLIETAMEHCDIVNVMICSLKAETIPGVFRYQSLLRYFAKHPRVKIIHITDENPQTPEEHPLFWGIWRKTVYDNVNKLDVVFTSEDYGEPFAEILGIEHFLVDKERVTIPISGTEVRANPLQNWEFIPNVVRNYFTKRIVILGGESTGKSTLTKKLAEHYDCKYVEEYGRTYTSTLEYPYQLDVVDFDRIAFGHIVDVEKYDPDAGKFLFVDTEAITTKVFGELFIPHFDSKNIDMMIKQQKYDLYLLLENDVPFVNDGTRLDEVSREYSNKRLKEELNKNKIKYVSISGSFDERFELAKKTIENLYLT
jgi:HTH-type transcriptional repressor of NAD biosynthesis genes